MPLESEATVRLARAFSELQTKYETLFIVIQLWSALVADCGNQVLGVPRVTQRGCPQKLSHKATVSLYSSLLVFGQFCRSLSSILRLHRRIRESGAGNHHPMQQ